MSEFKKMLVFSYLSEAIGYATVTRNDVKAHIRFSFNAPHTGYALILSDKAYRLPFSGEKSKAFECAAKDDVHIILPYKSGYIYASTGKKLDSIQISEALSNEKSQVIVNGEEEDSPPRGAGVREENRQSGELSLFPLYRDDEVALVNFYPSDLTFSRESDAMAEAASTEAAHEKSLRGSSSVRHVRAEAIVGRKADFYEGVKDHIDKLFSSYERFSALESKLPSSKWVKVEYGAGAHYLVGVVGDPPELIAYAVEGVFDSPPEEFEGYGKWTATEDGKGYWIIFQSALNGETLKDA